MGGHIGDGIRPSERKKGYATQMIGLALEECKKLGINKVLMVCDKENIGSAISIIKKGGILENELIENCNMIENCDVNHTAVFPECGYLEDTRKIKNK